MNIACTAARGRLQRHETFYHLLTWLDRGYTLGAKYEFLFTGYGYSLQF